MNLSALKLSKLIDKLSLKDSNTRGGLKKKQTLKKKQNLELHKDIGPIGVGLKEENTTTTVSTVFSETCSSLVSKNE